MKTDIPAVDAHLSAVNPPLRYPKMSRALPRSTPTEEQLKALPPGAKFIPLPHGLFAMVNEEDFEELNKFNWTCQDGYVIRRATFNGKRRKIWMHRVILKTPDGMETDHASGDQLDNRRTNLRSATKSQNAANRKLYASSTSGVKGVIWYKRYRCWRSTIAYQNKRHHIGYFKTKALAVAARRQAALRLHGEFCSLLSR